MPGYSRVALMPLLSGALMAAGPSVLQLRIPNETVPAGGAVQIKIFLATPKPGLAGRVVLKLDPAVFGDIAAVNVLSATGDAYGYAKVEGRQVDATFTSLAGGIGRLSDQPVMTIAAPVLAGTRAGTTAQITADAGGSSWKDADGNEYAIAVTPGAVTVGGTLSVTSVTPGGGPLAAGAVVAIEGAGFSASTSVELAGVAASAARVVSSQRMELSLAAPADLTGNRVRVRNADGSQVDFFAALNPAPVLAPADAALAALRPLIPLRPVVAAQLPSFGRGTALVLANQNPHPVDITFRALGLRSVVMSKTTATLPPGGLYIRDTSEFGGFFVQVVASAPVRMLQLAYAYAVDARPVTPIPLPVTQLWPLTTELVWEWQIGAPPPAAKNVPVCSTGEALPFTASVSTDSGTGWLSAPAEGRSGLASSAPCAANFPVTVDTTGLAEGIYKGTITLTPIGPNPRPSVLRVSLNVNAQPFIATRVTGYGFPAPLGGKPPEPAVVQISSSGAPVKFTVTSTAPWLSAASSADTTPATLTITADPTGLEIGTYSGNILVHGPANELTIAITLWVSQPSPPSEPGPPPPGTMRPDPATLTFSAPAGGAAPQPQVVAIHPVFSPVTATVDTGAPWLAAAIRGADWVVTVSVNPAGLAPGKYAGAVTINSAKAAGPVKVPVTLIVWSGSAPRLAVVPASLAFAGSQGYTQRVSVTSGDIPLTFTIRVDEGFQWLSVAQWSQTLTTPATLEIGFDARQLLPGTYRGAVALTASTGTLQMPVTLTVPRAVLQPEGEPFLATVANAASLAQGAVAPGEILSLFGLPLGWDGGPEGARVLFDGIPGEVLYSSAAQVNVVAPAEIAGRPATSIEVEWKGAKSAARGIPVAADSPAVFTADASGRGPAVAVNQDGAANSPANPAGRGSIIELYATGVNSTPAVAIGGKAAAVQQHQAARGITRLWLMVPPDAAVGAAVPVMVTAGGAGSQAGATVAVK